MLELVYSAGLRVSELTALDIQSVEWSQAPSGSGAKAEKSVKP
jgi:site-specific recombinase XerC